MFNCTWEGNLENKMLLFWMPVQTITAILNNDLEGYSALRVSTCNQNALWVCWGQNSNLVVVWCKVWNLAQKQNLHSVYRQNKSGRMCVWWHHCQLCLLFLFGLHLEDKISMLFLYSCSIGKDFFREFDFTYVKDSGDEGQNIILLPLPSLYLPCSFFPRHHMWRMKLWTADSVNLFLYQDKDISCILFFLKSGQLCIWRHPSVMSN